MKKSSHFETAKALTALFIVLIAFGVMMLFYTNMDNIIQGESFVSFITLTAIAFSLLMGLMYLVNNSKHPSLKVNRVSSSKKHKKGRR